MYLFFLLLLFTSHPSGGQSTWKAWYATKVGLRPFTRALIKNKCCMKLRPTLMDNPPNMTHIQLQWPFFFLSPGLGSPLCNWLCFAVEGGRICSQGSAQAQTDCVTARSKQRPQQWGFYCHFSSHCVRAASCQRRRVARWSHRQGIGQTNC